MTQNPPDMKIRFSAELRRQVEDAARSNNRTMSAEIISRLERTFREDAERGEGGEHWLSRTQRSPSIVMEKRLLVFEVELEEKIEGLREGLKDHEKRIAALEQRSSKK